MTYSCGCEHTLITKLCTCWFMWLYPNLIKLLLFITLVNTQNVPANKIVDFSSIQCAETKYGLKIQFLALVVMIHEVWLKA